MPSYTSEPGPSDINNDDKSGVNLKDDDYCIYKQFVPPENIVKYVTMAFGSIQCEVCEHWVHFTCF